MRFGVRSLINDGWRCALELTVAQVSDEQVKVGYECPCGCRPKVRYEKGADAVDSQCCCGRSFVVGPSEDGHEGIAEVRVIRSSFTAPWGETVPAIWIEPEPGS